MQDQDRAGRLQEVRWHPPGPGAGRSGLGLYVHREELQGLDCKHAAGAVGPSSEQEQELAVKQLPLDWMRLTDAS